MASTSSRRSKRPRSLHNGSQASSQRTYSQRSRRPPFGQRGRQQRPSGRQSVSYDDSVPSIREASAPVQSQQDAENQEQHQEQEEGDDLCQVVMAIDVRGSAAVGCCYYLAREEKIYVLEDITSGGLEIVETLKVDIQPTVVLLSTRADQGTSNQEQNVNCGQTTDEDDPQFRLPYHVDIRPSQEFDYNSATSKLANLRYGIAETGTTFLVPGDTFSHGPAGDDLGFTDQQGKLLNLSGSIDMENRISVGCTGALITYLRRKKAAGYLQEHQSGGQVFRVKSIEMLSLKGSMFVNKDTLASLQIIQSESHPNAFNQGPSKTSPGSKEGLSIFGLFQYFARTPQGRALLRQHFLRPITDMDIIKQRQDFISTFLRPDNDPVVERLTKSLKGIKNLRPVMIHLHKGISSGNARFRGFKSIIWVTLIEFAFHSIDVHESLRSVIGGQELELRARALQKLDVAKLHQVGRAIHEIVDLQSSAEERRTIVKPGVDRELDNLKETYNGMDSLLSQVARNIAATLPEDANSDLNVIYFPQLGFNIAMPLDEMGRAVYDGSDEGWDQVFTTENRAYFKDYRMREMDERLGDMYGLICEKEIEIVYELAQNVLQFETLLIEASDICGEIDSLLALAQSANMYKLVRPQVVQDNIVDIKGGRHLLSEATVPLYVPNDTFIIGGKGSGTGDSRPPAAGATMEEAEGPSMLLLTGPNYSGKSVYLKQVALIVYMAHIGSFVPAGGAKIGLTDKILTRITTRETVSKIQSTFMTDLQQISLALNLATHRSLLIIDEFGKGTESTDGAGLACGLLEYLLNLGDSRPKVLAATHFHEIFENKFIRPRRELEFAYMEVQVDPEAEEVENQITYLYNLRSGRSNASFGANCAALNGIDPAIISRANEISTLSHRGEDLVTVCAEMSASEMNDLEEAEIIARRFLETDFSEPFVDGSVSDDNDPAMSVLEEIIGGTDYTSQSMSLVS